MPQTSLLLFFEENSVKSNEVALRTQKKLDRTHALELKVNVRNNLFVFCPNFLVFDAAKRHHRIHNEQQLCSL